MTQRYPIFVKRDLDGFFGLAIDNLVQLLLIVELCGAFCGMTGPDAEFIYRRILPGAAVSLLVGNLFYAFQAHWVARRERRSDVTALPYGINTPSLLVYVFFVMKPAYDRTHDAAFAWQLGLVACLGSGIIEFLGAFFAEKLRRNTPRGALLSTLAGIAITFIAMKFALEIWDRPLVAMIPLAVILLVYFSHLRFPLGLPGGLVAVLIGTALAWGLALVGQFGARQGWAWLQLDTGVPLSTAAASEAYMQTGRYFPQWSWPAILEVLRSNPAQAAGLLSVIVPMGLFNVIGSLQNIESAEAGGDVFATGPSLAVNGLGTLAAALFGSCFPTTIYIGHPGWKRMGARAGYSTLNGLAMTAVCLTGSVAVIRQVVPMEAGIAIVLWIGIIITAQAFQATPLRHAPAVAFGLFPAIAGWGATVMAGAFTAAAIHTPQPAPVAAASAPAAELSAAGGVAGGRPAAAATEADDSSGDPSANGRTAAGPIRVATMQDVICSLQPGAGRRAEVNGFLIHGLNVMERGYIFTCMIVAAVSAFLIDRRYRQAAAWCAVAAVLTFLGLMHAYQLRGNTLDYWLLGTRPAEGAWSYGAGAIALGYLLMALIFMIVGAGSGSVAEPPANTLQDARVVPVEDDRDPGELLPPGA